MMGGPGSGARPRVYPPEIVALVCDMYRAGHTVAEIRAAVPRGYRVQTILERHLDKRRPATPRDQHGERNAAWRNLPGYAAAHLRLGPVADRVCVDCDALAQEWSFSDDCPQTIRSTKGRYCLHAEHYAPRCTRCHRRIDARRRSA